MSNIVSTVVREPGPCEKNLGVCGENGTCCDSYYCQRRVDAPYQCKCKIGWTGDNCDQPGELTIKP